MERLMLNVGLTGGVASGKSAVRRFFALFGAEVFDADEAVHELLKNGTPEHRRIVRRFGAQILNGAQIDRRRLRARVTGDRPALVFLERVLHPGVRRLLAKRAAALKRRKGVFVAEVPLLYETGLDRRMDRVVAVIAPRRAQLRNGRAKKLGPEDIERFSKRQWDQKRKAAKADVVIRNDSTLASLKRKAKEVFHQLSQEAGY
jgi:dephospho-CoA kinase